jgi:hypothetical protein
MCQRVFQYFDVWLSRQAPRGRTTKDAADFEKYMRETASNLRKLGLSEQESKVEGHTASSLRQINALAAAQSLAENIEGWLTERSTSRAQKVAELRNCNDIAKENVKKVTETLRTLPLSALESVKAKLNDLIKANKQREKEFVTRLSRIDDPAIFAIHKIDELLQEVDDLEKIFERCDSDIDALRSMRRALNFYKNAYVRLSDVNLSEDAFSALWSELNDQSGEISDDEPPWMPEDIMPVIQRSAIKRREELGLHWLSGIEEEVLAIKGSDIADANNLITGCSKYLDIFQKGNTNAQESFKMTLRHT